MTPERVIPAHEVPSSKTKKLLKEDPRAMLKFMYKKSEQINDQLFDFVNTPMHGPTWEEKLTEIRKVSRKETKGVIPMHCFNLI